MSRDGCPHLLAIIRLTDHLLLTILWRVLLEHLLLPILWRVHEDARHFFLRNGDAIGRGTDGCQEHHMPLRQVPREEEGQGERRGEEKGRVDKAKPGDEPKKLEPQATVNPTIPTLCIATMKKIKTATITEFAAQTGIPLKDLLCSSRGSCSNFALFGVCTSGCPYNHSTASVPDGRQKDANSQLIQELKVLDEKKKATLA